MTPAMVAVKNFSLNRNDKVLLKLDSVFFAIDLNTGVIFNADSLPVDTDVSKLVASITFANTMTKAELSYINENSEKVTIDYLTNPQDTIDFRQPVELDVTAENGEAKFTYQIKVNVHLQEPDTLKWVELATSKLPSRFENPVVQKTLIHKETAYCLVEENNGSYTLSTSRELNEGIWNKEPVEFGFEPNVESFTTSPETFWILATNGDLYSSKDALTWERTGANWVSIVGAYEDSMFGIRQNGDNLVHTVYPMEQDFEESVIEEGFPISDFTTMYEIESQWADHPFAILACGLTQEGNYSSGVWAYDGSRWGLINNDTLPGLKSPSMVRYVVYRDTPVPFTQRRFDVWFLTGGTDQEGEFNKKVYLSYDNGVNWQIAPDMMQLPEDLPSLSGSDLIVAGYELNADLSEAWTPAPTTRDNKLTRSAYIISGYDITWVCPYLYIFGGFLPDGSLNTEIWRGVLERLTFMPVI